MTSTGSGRPAASAFAASSSELVCRRCTSCGRRRSARRRRAAASAARCGSGRGGRRSGPGSARSCSAGSNSGTGSMTCSSASGPSWSSRSVGGLAAERADLDDAPRARGLEERGDDEVEEGVHGSRQTLEGRRGEPSPQVRRARRRDGRTPCPEAERTRRGTHPSAGSESSSRRRRGPDGTCPRRAGSPDARRATRTPARAGPSSQGHRPGWRRLRPSRRARATSPCA